MSWPYQPLPAAGLGEPSSDTVSTTSAYIAANSHVQTAWVLAFEGHNLLHTTTDDLTGIATAWAATDWTTVKGGLGFGLKGGGNSTFQQSIKAFEPELQPSSLTIRVLDYDGTLAAYMAGTPSTTTFLASSVDNNDTTVNVDATSAFASSGDLYIGHEHMTYAGKNGTNFTTVTRGLHSLFTNENGDDFAPYHRISPNTLGEPGNAPRVSSTPGTWFNRRVGLFMHHREPPSTAWSTKADSLFYWCGRIKKYRVLANGWIELDCLDVREELNRTLFLEQFRAVLGKGRVLTKTEHRYLKVAVTVNYDPTGSANYSPTATSLGSIGYTYTHDEWAQGVIQAQLNSWQNAGSISSSNTWSVELRETDDGPRYAIRMKLNGQSFLVSAAQSVAITMHRMWWQLLGFDPPEDVVRDSSETSGSTKTLPFTGNVDYVEIVAAHPPLVVTPFYDGIHGGPPGWQVNYSDAVGTWYDQTSGDMVIRYQIGSGAATVPAVGFLGVGGGDRATLVSVSNLATSTQTITVNGRTNTIPIEDVVELGASTDPIELYQVYFQYFAGKGSGNNAGTLLLRLVLMTGTNAYNHSLYDNGSWYGLGLGLPYSMIDVNSWASLDCPYEIVLDKARPFHEIAEPLLAVSNRFIIWNNGKLYMIRPGFDTPNVDDVVTLNENNKASPDDKPTVTYAADGIINRLRLKYGSAETMSIEVPGMGDRVKAKTINVEDVASASDFGQTKTREIECIGLREPQYWADYVVKPALAYFSQPLARIERTFNMSLLGSLVPGTICKITDNWIVDPATGTRGVSGLACWVESVEFDFATGVGRVSLLFLPSHPASKYCTFAPSALVSNYATSTAVITCSAHAFSRSTEGVDVSYFSANDAVKLIKLNTAAGTTYDATVSSVSAGANTITLSSDPTGGTGLGSGYWVVTFDSYADCQTSQKDKAFVANRTGTISVAGDGKAWAQDNNRWHTYLSLTDASPAQWYQTFVRPTNAASAQGSPYAVHTPYDQILSLNNLFGQKLRGPLLGHMYTNPATHDAATWKVVYGPAEVPLLPVDDGHTSKPTIRVRAYMGKTSASGTSALFRLTTCTRFPTDATDALDVTFQGGTASVQLTSTASSLEYQEGTIANPAINFESNVAYMYVVGELKANGGTAQFQQLELFMDKLGD